MTTTNVSTLALTTIGVLSERDWCQGQPEDSDGHVCLVGAVNTAAYGPFDEGDPTVDDYGTPAVKALADALLELGITDRYNSFGDSVSAMYGWNDNPHRTAMQVAAALVTVSQECVGQEIDIALS